MTHTTQGIVLKKIPAGEADAVVVLYTRDFGKLRAYVQGVKKESAKLKGHIESLSLVFVQFVMGASGERLTYAQMLEPWSLVRSDFNRCATALYITELVDRHCLVSQSDVGIWELLMGSFVELDRKEMPACNKLMDRFEREFLISLGYGAHTDMRTLGPALARPPVIVYNDKCIPRRKTPRDLRAPRSKCIPRDKQTIVSLLPDGNPRQHSTATLKG